MRISFGSHTLDGPDAAGMARPPMSGVRAEPEDARALAAVREGVLPEGRQPRARADRRGNVSKKMATKASLLCSI